MTAGSVNGNGVGSNPIAEPPSKRARQSVARNNATSYKVQGGRVILGSDGLGLGLEQPLPKYLPRAMRARDRVLYFTPRAESQWGGAVRTALTKLAATNWDIASTTSVRRRKLQQLLVTADYGHPSGVFGWVPFVSRLGRDFLTTNNGAFFQVARETRSVGSRIKALWHLPSLRCRRTGDPDYPVLYTDRLGTEHPLRWYEVGMMVDCPESADELYGGGFCAADAAYDQIKKLAAMEVYTYEKLTANRPLVFYLVSGITQEQIDNTLDDALEQQDEDGLTQYMGALIAATLKRDTAPGMVSIPLAGLPENANPVAERARSDLIYANSLGMDVNEIRPHTGQVIGAGAQSQVMHEKQKGKGIVAFRSQLGLLMNWLVFDPKSQFYFTERDLVDEERRARIAQGYTSAAGTMVQSGTASPEQAQEWLIDKNIIPRRFAHRDLQAEVVSDTDKPALDESLDTEGGKGEQPISEFVDPKKVLEPQPSLTATAQVGGGRVTANLNQGRVKGGGNDQDLSKSRPALGVTPVSKPKEPRQAGDTSLRNSSDTPIMKAIRRRLAYTAEQHAQFELEED